MLRVLHVSAAAERGGLEAILLNIVNCLDRSRFHPIVVLLEGGPLFKEVEETRTEAYVVLAGRVRNIVKGGRAVASLVRLIRHRQVHLVHSHNAKAHIYGGFAARIAGIPSLYHLHGIPKLALSRDGMVSLLSRVIPAQQIVACSEYVAEGFKSAWHTRRKVEVVHNGVVLPGAALRDGPETVHEEFGLPKKAPLIVMASRLQRGKGVHVFLDSAADVFRRYPEACFMVVGGTLFGLEAGYAHELHRHASRLGLDGAVVFTGYRADVSRFFQAADVVVHCSIHPDSFPTVLLEAMAWGKPVVATDSGGPREIVEHGVTGLLVPPDRPDLLSQAILKLLGDSVMREQLGLAGAARIRAEFQATRMTEQFEALYEDAVGEKRG
jgi:glycosyltransferase involved in cell wall biosynthesis